MLKEAVFFDRDGTLNRSNIINNKSHAPTTFDDFELFPEAEDVIKKLKDSNFVVLVITNQPTISTGILSLSELEKMNNHLLKILKVDDIHYCPHIDTASCDCRKPKAGMLFAAEEKHGIDLFKSFVVGDTWRDIAAGKSAGCKTILLKRLWSEREKCTPHYVVNTLTQALDIILQRSKIQAK